MISLDLDSVVSIRDNEKEGDKDMMNSFYEKHLKEGYENSDMRYLSSDGMKELKDNGVSTEKFLQYVCDVEDVMLHGLTCEIKDASLHSSTKVFATDVSGIALLKALYTNRGAVLHYPNVIDESHPLILTVELLRGK